MVSTLKAESTNWSFENQIHKVSATSRKWAHDKEFKYSSYSL